MRKFSVCETARALRTNQTVAEKALWRRLRRKQVMGYKFRRQHPMNGYIVDFYCIDVNLVIEVDGCVHDNQREHDAIRQSEITAKSGASFLRFSNEDILYRIEEVITQISEYLKKNPYSFPHRSLTLLRGRAGEGGGTRKRNNANDQNT